MNMTATKTMTINDLIAPRSAELSEEDLALVFGGDFRQTLAGISVGAIALGSTIASSFAVGAAAVGVAATLGITATAPVIATAVAGFGIIALAAAPKR